MTNIHAVPEGLPPIPEGEVYLGKGPLCLPNALVKFSGHAIYSVRGRDWHPSKYFGNSTDHYTAPLDSEVARHVLARRVPDGVPPLPEGYVYAGRLGDYPEGSSCLGIVVTPFGFTWGNTKTSWSGVGSVNSRTGDWHYATPIDSDLARKLLGMESGKPESELAGIQRGMDEALARNDVWSGTPDGWVAPETHEEALREIGAYPDLIIPRDAALEMNAYLWIEELTNAGYRLEIDSSGIRGWKEK